MSDVVLGEVGHDVDAGGIRTNVLQAGEGAPVVLVHGSGPGVTAYANWRLTISYSSSSSNARTGRGRP